MRTVVSVVIAMHAVCSTLGLLGTLAAAASLGGRRMLVPPATAGPAIAQETPTALEDTGVCGGLVGGACSASDSNTGCAATSDGSEGAGSCAFEMSHATQHGASGGEEAEGTVDDSQGPGMGRSLQGQRRRGRTQGRQNTNAGTTRTRTGKRAPRRVRPADPRRTRTGKRAPPRHSRSTRGHDSKPSPSPARPSRPAPHSSKGSSIFKWPSFSRNRNSRPASLGRKGMHAPIPPTARRSSDHRHGQRRGSQHRHGHHESRRNTNPPSEFKRFNSGNEDVSQGSSSTVYVKGDVDTLVVTSSGDGYIGVPPHSGRYGVPSLVRPTAKDGQPPVHIFPSPAHNRNLRNV